MIDEESERAVSRWVRLGDEVAGHPTADASSQCESCGTTDNVLDRGAHALCAHCYLEGVSQAKPADGLAEAAS